VASHVVSAQGMKDFTKARDKAETKFYLLSKGGKGLDTIGNISPIRQLV
jgi:hypothetical protein